MVSNWKDGRGNEKPMILILPWKCSLEELLEKKTNKISASVPS
jgi:hypothetical protein